VLFAVSVPDALIASHKIGNQHITYIAFVFATCAKNEKPDTMAHLIVTLWQPATVRLVSAQETVESPEIMQVDTRLHGERDLGKTA
jgi:hypothetical protein